MEDHLQQILESDSQTLDTMIMDAARRIIVHFGLWMAQVDHQLGPAEAARQEEKVWPMSLGNQLGRLAKTLGFELDERGVPQALAQLPRDKKVDLLKALAINWLANDGIWFQAVEGDHGLWDAKRCNDTCWGRFSPFEALRIKEILGLGPRPGLEGLKQALGLRLYAIINEQSMHDEGPESFVFRMDNCRVQAARKRKGLEDYPCKSAGLVEYPYFARAIDDRIVTECVGCPPDPHPEEWFCAWRFTLKAE